MALDIPHLILTGSRSVTLATLRHDARGRLVDYARQVERAATADGEPLADRVAALRYLSRMIALDAAELGRDATQRA